MMRTRKRAREEAEEAPPAEEVAGAKKARSGGREGPASAPAEKASGRGKTAKPAAKPKAAAAAKPKAQPKAQAGKKTIQINRAPVLTAWAAVVAQRQGYSWDAALTFGRAVSGIMAQSKGRALGIYEEWEKSEEELRERERRDREAGVERVPVFGMHLAAAPVGGERRAVAKGKPIEPASVQKYLDKAFGEQLEDVKGAMEELAAAIPRDQIGGQAYPLYEKFRPAWKGWGAKGTLSLTKIRGLARSWRGEE